MRHCGDGQPTAASRPDARYDGVIGIWYGKAPGVDRASDAIRHAMFAGADPRVRGDAGRRRPQRQVVHFAVHLSGSAGRPAHPCALPRRSADVLELGRHAIAMSRATGLWVGMKIVANVADGSADVSPRPNRVNPVIPLHEGKPYQHRPDTRLLTPYTLDFEREIVEGPPPIWPFNTLN